MISISTATRSNDLYFLRNFQSSPLYASVRMRTSSRLLGVARKSEGPGDSKAWMDKYVMGLPITTYDVQ